MKILLIEDEPDLASALVRYLTRNGYGVDSALDGGAGLALAEVNQYDLLILDLNLPDIDGIEVLQALRAAQPDLLVLVVTARYRLQERVYGLDQGADDYLAKPFHIEEMHARIRALLRRDRGARQPELRCGDIALDTVTRTVWRGERSIDLTRRQYAVLEHLMRRPGEVVSQEELLEHVWGSEMNPFTNTIRMHIFSLRRKLGDGPSGPPIIETVVGEGYRLNCQNAQED